MKPEMVHDPNCTCGREPHSHDKMDNMPGSAPGRKVDNMSMALRSAMALAKLQLLAMQWSPGYLSISDYIYTCTNAEQITCSRKSQTTFQH